MPDLRLRLSAKTSGMDQVALDGVSGVDRESLRQTGSHDAASYAAESESHAGPLLVERRTDSKRASGLTIQRDIRPDKSRLCAGSSLAARGYRGELPARSLADMGRNNFSAGTSASEISAGEPLGMGGHGVRSFCSDNRHDHRAPEAILHVYARAAHHGLGGSLGSDDYFALERGCQIAAVVWTLGSRIYLGAALLLLLPFRLRCSSGPGSLPALIPVPPAHTGRRGCYLPYCRARIVRLSLDSRPCLSRRSLHLHPAGSRN